MIYARSAGLESAAKARFNRGLPGSTGGCTLEFLLETGVCMCVCVLAREVNAAARMS